MSAGLDYYAHMTRPVQQPPRYRTCPEKCADLGHPGVTYNPWQDRTWCLCGAVITDGNTITWPKADRPGGPLTEGLNVTEATE